MAECDGPFWKMLVKRLICNMEFSSKNIFINKNQKTIHKQKVMLQSINNDITIKENYFKFHIIVFN